MTKDEQIRTFAKSKAKAAQKFGEYLVGHGSPGKIVIMHESGEGGEFPEADFVRMLDKFYKDNF